jgi:hypothetical protein
MQLRKAWIAVGTFSDGFDKVLSLKWTKLQCYLLVCVDVKIDICYSGKNTAQQYVTGGY